MALTTPGMGQAVLLLSCQDSSGIVAEVSHFVATYGGNILDSLQHSDVETNTFFMRVSWDLEGFKIPQEKIHSAFEPISMKFGMDYRVEFSGVRKKVAIFVSKYDHCLIDLLWRTRSGEIHGDIKMVISNHPDLRRDVEHFDIPFHHIPVSKGKKTEAEQQAFDLMDQGAIDLVVLARYMQILSPEFVKRYPQRIINIHHSFLPAFIGAKPYHQAYQRGVKLIGATSHYVTEELDQGPIISQDVQHISHRDSIGDLVTKGRNVEKLVLSRAVKAHLEHKVLAYDNKTVVFE